MGSQVPLHVNKPQHGGKAPTFEPQETIKIWLIIIILDLDYFMYKYLWDWC